MAHAFTGKETGDRMRKRNSRAKGLLLIVLLLAAAIGIVLIKLRQPKEETPEDPHAGQVLVNDGFNDVWITPIEGVEVNELKKEDFDNDAGKVVYTGEDYDTILGIDVSEWQGDIDWKQVADSGVKFAYIRSGYRGYTKGTLKEDPCFQQNMKGASDNGIQTGVYFLSQAVNVAEAMEEARYVLEQTEGFDLDLPIVFDWEKYDAEQFPDARTNDVELSIMSECAVAFCETIKAAGRDAGVYFNLQYGYYGFDLGRLKDFMLWVADPTDYPKFYYSGNIWQYTHGGEVPGIEGQVDMDLMFIKRPDPAPGTEEAPQP